MSSTETGFRESVRHARERWQDGRQVLRHVHDENAPGNQIVHSISDLQDHVLLDLYKAAMAELPPGIQSQIALVLHGGSGRREVSPFSDVDMMMLHPGVLTEELTEFSRRISQDITDSSLQLGFSLRSPREACSMALTNPEIFSSLTESRILCGNLELFQNYMSRLTRLAQRRSTNLIRGLVEARKKERAEFGETVYLLRPNIKKSRGGLRDIHLIRWIGFIRYGDTDIDQLCRRNALLDSDATKLSNANEFLLRVRNDLHFHANRAQDGLGRNEQVRIAEKFGYVGDEAVLPVERLMQTYFGHSSQIAFICDQFIAKSLSRKSLASNVFSPLVTKNIGDHFFMGPTHIGVVPASLDLVKNDLQEVLRMMQLASIHGKIIDYNTWDAIREAMSTSDEIELTRQSSEQFMALLSNTKRLAEMLFLLHEMRVLEKIIPAFTHARNLLQFNEYHKYTVDEHSLQAVRKVTSYESQSSIRGETYRKLRDKQILHLALLLHDLGKGYPEDHSEVGRRIADVTGKRLGLSHDDTEDIKFLVHNHLVMTHLAFHRDTNDENMIAEFASNVGTVRMLSMLYVLTCADVSAVGPGVMTPWKYELLTNLFLKAKDMLTGEANPDSNRALDGVYSQIALAGSDSEEMQKWLHSSAKNLPKNYCVQHSAESVAHQLMVLRDTIGDNVQCWVNRVEGTKLVELCIGKRERRRSGLFYKLTGMLASQGLNIQSADIRHIGNSLVFYWFKFEDLEFDDPPKSRMEDIKDRAKDFASGLDDGPPTFRAKWGKQTSRALTLSRPKIEVKIDNQSVDDATIIDVFAYEKLGLLYMVSRKLNRLGLEVTLARVSGYAHQVIAVFYVTDEQGNKIRNKNQLRVIKQELYQATKNYLEPSDDETR